MKNVYVSWHYTTHGIAYLKHILSRFYENNDIKKEIDYSELNQEKLNGVFDNKNENGFVFNKIIYLTAPQKTLDKLSGRRIKSRETILIEKEIIDGLEDVYEEFKNDNNSERNPFDSLEDAIGIVEEKFPEKKDVFVKKIWKNIHHYPVKEQIKWLQEYSNFRNVYLDKLVVKEIEIDDLRDEEKIAQKLKKELKNEFGEKYDNFIVNISKGSEEIQVVWHILSGANILPQSTRFIKVLDEENKGKLKTFRMEEINPKTVLSIIDEIKIYESTNSEKRKLVNEKIKTFMNNNFPIFLIGERGTGKTTLVKKNKGESKIIEANCASFADDIMAESELFGYKEGTFTGALKGGKEGLFQEAKDGVLFLDEIHRLSEKVQAKLMKTLQPDDKGNFLVRRFGAAKEEEIKCKIIFASNKSVEELKEILLPDFYDRIVQQVVEIPPVRDTREDIEKDWEEVWNNTVKNDKRHDKHPKDENFINWLKILDLYGNFRDLEKIAMYYYIFDEFSEEAKKMIVEKNAFEYAKNEFEKYHSNKKQNSESDISLNVETGKTADDLTKEFHFQLQKWAIKKYGTREKASEMLKTSTRTLNNWKNKKQLTF